MLRIITASGAALGLVFRDAGWEVFGVGLNTVLVYWIIQERKLLKRVIRRLPGPPKRDE